MVAERSHGAPPRVTRAVSVTIAPGGGANWPLSEVARTANGMPPMHCSTVQCAPFWLGNASAADGFKPPSNAATALSNQAAATFHDGGGSTVDQARPNRTQAPL